jgi:hypothetical protein
MWVGFINHKRLVVFSSSIIEMHSSFGFLVFTFLEITSQMKHRRKVLCKIDFGIIKKPTFKTYARVTIWFFCGSLLFYLRDYYKSRHTNWDISNLWRSDVCMCRWLWDSGTLDFVLWKIPVGKTSSHWCACHADCDYWDPSFVIY